MDVLKINDDDDDDDDEFDRNTTTITNLGVSFKQGIQRLLQFLFRLLFQNFITTLCYSFKQNVTILRKFKSNICLLYRRKGKKQLM